jgi:hypothetical protein
MLDKQGKVVTTSITNLDIHDISRSARTFGIEGYFLVNPEEEQANIARRIMAHWNTGGGRDYNPDRTEAFKRTRLVAWLDDAIAEIQAECEGVRPKVVMTTARTIPGLKLTAFSALREEIESGNQPTLLVFGTGWGMEESLLRTADVVLEPIRPRSESNYLHLSVRAAAVIVFDRLLGAR